MSSGGSWFSSLTDKVQATVEQQRQNLSHPEQWLEKLTLTTPELQAERQRIEREEKYKEKIKHMLANLLPWETRDPDREILVEECKESILQLSKTKDTFFGPYPMPRLSAKTGPNATSTGDDGDQKEEEEDDDDEKEPDDGMDPTKPSPESLEKLSKLEPLPTLLQNFDFQAHVGLIERMLKLDETLVQMQSQYSGGGQRERCFWRNYFFHCAFARYEAGMSIDEIWSEEYHDSHHGDDETQPSSATAQTASASATTKMSGSAADQDRGDAEDGEDHPHEETITFEEQEEAGANKAPAAAAAKVDSSLFAKQQPATNNPTATNRSESGEFEMVDDGGNDNHADTSEDDINMENEGDNNPLEDADYELDELEAEIARELEED